MAYYYVVFNSSTIFAVNSSILLIVNSFTINDNKRQTEKVSRYLKTTTNFLCHFVSHVITNPTVRKFCVWTCVCRRKIKHGTVNKIRQVFLKEYFLYTSTTTERIFLWGKQLWRFLPPKGTGGRATKHSLVTEHILGSFTHKKLSGPRL